MLDPLLSALLFIVEILPALLFSIFVEKHYVQQILIVLYGLQTFAFLVTVFFVFPGISYIFLILLAIVGILWVVIGALDVTHSTLIGYKTTASIQVPIVLHGYKIFIWSEISYIIPVTMIVLAFVFHFITWYFTD